MHLYRSWVDAFAITYLNEDLLTPKSAHKVRKVKEEKKAKQKQLYDRTAKHLPMLKPGDMVRLRDISTGAWRQKGLVEEEVAPRSYRIQTENGLSLRRNRADLQLQPTEKDITAKETVQQDTAESTELTDSGLTAVSASPAAATPSKLSKSPAAERQARPKRHLRG